MAIAISELQVNPMGLPHLSLPRHAASPHGHRARARRRPHLPSDDALRGEEEEKERFHAGTSLHKRKLGLGLILVLSWECGLRKY